MPAAGRTGEGGEAMQGPVMATPTTGLSSATAGKASVRPTQAPNNFALKIQF